MAAVNRIADRSNMLVMAMRLGLATATLFMALLGISSGQLINADATDPSIQSRVEQLETTLQAVVEENRRLAEEVRTYQGHANSPLLVSENSADWYDVAAMESMEMQEPSGVGYWAGYDNGFVIRPYNLEESPFTLKINNQNTFRFSGFSRDEAFWVDNAGNVELIRNTSDFLIPRGRLIFSGNAFLPDFTYLLNIDYNTVGRNAIGFRAFTLSYRFSRALEVSVGQNKVPGSREWLLSSWVAQEGPDRSMATTFFRPSLSQGIWLKGEPIAGLHYTAMVSNGFNTLNQTPDQSNHRLCWSDSIWWEPWGDFGAGYSDLEDHQELVMRLGTSFTAAIGQGPQVETDAIENSLVRLSDGTLINETGAFAPGVTLQRYDLSLTAIDLAFKYRGCSLSSEVYFQELSSLQGNGPLPIQSTRAYGGFAQGGYFLLPQQFEIYGRTSWVTGEYGSGSEIAGGLNWFVLKGKSNLRFTFDVAELESSPAGQNRTGFFAGQSGILIRTQINSSF